MVVQRFAVRTLQGNVSVGTGAAKVMRIEVLAIRFMATDAGGAMAAGAVGQYDMVTDFQVLDVGP
jgi:hypothetical protein